MFQSNIIIYCGLVERTFVSNAHFNVMILYSFKQIPEFIELKKRLDCSLHFASVNYENMVLDAFLKANR